MIQPASLILPKEIINQAYKILIHAYAQTESEIWGENYVRISRNDYYELIEKGEIFFSFNDEQVNGCIQITQPEEKVFSFGLLAVDFKQKGQGIGKKLIKYAENYAIQKGGKKMVLEVLKPASFEVPFKLFLHEFYTRLGYQHEKTIPFLSLKTEKVEKAKQLIVPAVFDCYSKNLT